MNNLCPCKGPEHDPGCLYFDRPKEIGDMLHAEVLEELEALSRSFTPADFDRLEGELNVRAASLHWTGDPLKQPPRAVLAAARAIKQYQPAILQSALP